MAKTSNQMSFCFQIRDTLSDDVLHVVREVYGIKTEPSNALRALQEKVSKTVLTKQYYLLCFWSFSAILLIFYNRDMQ